MTKCINCMTDVENPNEKCPSCGFDPAAYQHPMLALPLGCMLHERYLMGKVLGQGGFGITYVAQDTLLDQRVAVKEYFPTGQATRMQGSTAIVWANRTNAASGRDSFLKEARKMAKIQNIPTVVNVKDMFIDNETAYIVMEYVEGVTLKEKILHGTTMYPEDAVRMLIPVMDGLAQVHEKGLIHRDISPDNIMVSPDGRLHLLDLGAAKDLNRSNGTSVLVAKNGFSPPEQYTQNGKVGPWMDVYALSATLVGMITGKVIPDAMTRLVENSMDLSMLPPALAEVLEKGLALKAENRYQSMTELKQALLEAIQDNRTQIITNPSREKPAVKQEKKTAAPEQSAKKGRKPLWIGIAAAAALCAVIALAVLLPGKEKPEAAEEAETTEETVQLQTEPETTPEQAEAAAKENRYQQAKELMDAGKYTEASYLFAALGDYRDAHKQNILCHTEIGRSIAAGGYFTVGLKSDGTVINAGSSSSGKNAQISWSGIEAVVAGDTGVVGIKGNGTIVDFGVRLFIGKVRDKSEWTDIRAAAVGSDIIVGIKSDGTTVWGGEGDTGSWTDIVEAAGSTRSVIGLRADGTVTVARHYFVDHPELTDWTDIAAIAAGGYHFVGLRSDGTVLVDGDINFGQANVGGWTDIVAVCAGLRHTVGLRADGTVVAVGLNQDGQCNVDDWTDIIAIAAGDHHTIGLKADGTVVAVGRNQEFQCKVQDWTDILVR